MNKSRQVSRKTETTTFKANNAKPEVCSEKIQYLFFVGLNPKIEKPVKLTYTEVKLSQKNHIRGAWRIFKEEYSVETPRISN